MNSGFYAGLTVLTISVGLALGIYTSINIGNKQDDKETILNMITNASLNNNSAEKESEDLSR